MKVLFNKNMAAVIYHAILESQNRNWPMSHTSRISGWRKQNFLNQIQRAVHARKIDDRDYMHTRESATCKARPQR